MKIEAESKSRGVRRWYLALGAALLALVSVQLVRAAVHSSITATATNQYVGADKCKSCHESAAAGDQYHKWTKEKHRNAFTTLTTPDAVALGTKHGVAEPSKSQQCLACHVTGSGEAADHFAKGFDPKLGVQCESCHGPGQKHVKARLAATDSGGGDAFGFEDASAKGPTQIPEGEIIKAPGEKRCLECHNSESPSFKAFNYAERHKEIAHKDPR